MKKVIALIAAMLALVALLVICRDTEENITAATTDFSEAAKVLVEVKTTQYFTEEAVAAADLEQILAAGVNAPSAMNTQPWHFTAVTNEETNQKLADAMGSMKPPAGAPNMPVPPAGAPEGVPAPPAAPEGGKTGFSRAASKAGMGDAPVTIVISCTSGSELSAGLAVQNMSVEAQLLGYGTKIMTAPSMALNGEEYLTLLNIPEGQQVVAVLLVGKAAGAEDLPDAAATPTLRNDFADVVTMIGA